MSKTNDKKTQELKKTLQEMENNWKRALADYRNLEKRVAEEKEDISKFANFVLVSQLLPILDNLELLGKHSSDDGLDLIIKEFKSVLESTGVEEIRIAQGDVFDPLLMEAIEAVQDDLDTPLVAEIVQAGYKLGSKLLRPARVNVKDSQGKEK